MNKPSPVVCSEMSRRQAFLVAEIAVRIVRPLLRLDGDSRILEIAGFAVAVVIVVD